MTTTTTTTTTVPPLDPSGDEARSWLRQELVRPEYHDRDLVTQVLDWLQHQLDRGVAAAGRAPAVSTLAAMLVALLLVGALVWLLGRVRRSPAARRARHGVLDGAPVSAAHLRNRAALALAEGRCSDAVLDGFRALAAGGREAGVLPDLRGLTAGEVATGLSGRRPDLDERLHAAAVLFDAVRYGDRPADREGAVSVLALEHEHAVRPAAPRAPAPPAAPR